MGWATLKNGSLLAMAAPHFDVILTVDRSIQFQQNQPSLPLSIVVLVAATIKIRERSPRPAN
jgi:hypothetical protein